jgi:hypothetical protein
MKLRPQLANLRVLFSDGVHERQGKRSITVMGILPRVREQRVERSARELGARERGIRASVDEIERAERHNDLVLIVLDGVLPRADTGVSNALHLKIAIRCALSLPLVRCQCPLLLGA